jgi:hypothetical protein
MYTTVWGRHVATPVSPLDNLLFHTPPPSWPSAVSIQCGRLRVPYIPRPHKTVYFYFNTYVKDKRSALFWDVTQRIAVIPYRRFGTNYRSLLWSRNLQDITLDFLKMGPIGCPEMSVRNYYYALRNIPEGRKSHIRRGGSLKPRKLKILFYPKDKTLGRGSSVGIAPRYGLDAPGIESRWGGGDIFRTRPARQWGSLSLLYNG